MPKPKSFHPVPRDRLSGDALLKAVGGSLVQVPPAAVQAAAPVVERRQKPVAFILRLSPRVFQAVEQRAEDEGTTMTVLIARALADAGYPVPEEDLRDRRRRRDYAALAGTTSRTPPDR